MAARWANLAARWGQDGAKMAQDRVWLAILRPVGSYLGYFWESWGRSLQKWLKCKNEHHYGVLATFSNLGGVWLEALGAILGHLGEKLGYLGRSWRQDGTLLAGCWDKDGEDEPRQANLGRKWVALGNEICMVAAGSVRARVGGCLELESRKV